MHGRAIRLSFIVVLTLCLSACGGWRLRAEEGGADVRESVLAGSWYPAEAGKLRRDIEGWLEQAGRPKLSGRVVALLAPHAGYVYSARVAAHAFAVLAEQEVDTLVVLAPSHRVAFDGVSVWDGGSWRTPLGLVELDREFIERLRGESGGLVRPLPEAHAKEHAVEIQLPFAQAVAPEARLVPLVLGRLGEQDLETLAQALTRTMKAFPERRAVLLASSDLSHYHDAETARKLDAELERRAAGLDPEGLVRSLNAGTCEACGGAALATVMLAARELGASRGEILAYGHSGEVNGDDSRVVGYLAAAFLVEEGRYGSEARALLHEIARESVLSRLEGREPVYPEHLPAELLADGAAFVTLKKQGRLRGCVGAVVAREPLAECVKYMARAAAFEDRRFPPLERGEYGELEFEISVMSPLEPIAPGDVVVGRHGLLVRRGWNQGLLLPQVPGEWGWDRETFLDQTCRKAGLDKGCWREEGAELFGFTAEVF